MSERIRRRAIVRGRVQGVYFRETVRRRARQEGVAGWVRNRGDGAVEALFEGPAEVVRRMIAFCHEGPPSARVTEVEVRQEEPQGLEGFDVR